MKKFKKGDYVKSANWAHSEPFVGKIVSTGHGVNYNIFYVHDDCNGCFYYVRPNNIVSISEKEYIAFILSNNSV